MTHALGAGIGADAIVTVQAGEALPIGSTSQLRRVAVALRFTERERREPVRARSDKSGRTAYDRRRNPEAPDTSPHRWRAPGIWSGHATKSYDHLQDPPLRALAAHLESLK